MTQIVDSIGQVVVAFTQGNPADDAYAVGLMIGYVDRPTAILETGHGEKISWVGELCRPATPSEAEEYWRRRAETAERKLERQAEAGMDERT